MLKLSLAVVCAAMGLWAAPAAATVICSTSGIAEPEEAPWNVSAPCQFGAGAFRVTFEADPLLVANLSVAFTSHWLELPPSPSAGVIQDINFGFGGKSQATFYVPNHTVPGTIWWFGAEEYDLLGVEVLRAQVSGPYKAEGWAYTFTIEAIPEPATWMVLISGFGLAGAALRRRARIALP